jgi:hypothetical protein
VLSDSNLRNEKRANQAAGPTTGAGQAACDRCIQFTGTSALRTQRVNPGRGSSLRLPMKPDASRLLAFGSPSRIGKTSAAKWSVVERVCGSLPADYKNLISTFGYGSFGDLVLFHPLARAEFNNLPRGERVALKILRAEASDVLNGFLLRMPRILGRGPERRFLAHDQDGWWFLAWDVEEISPIGKDLCEFIHDTFASLHKRKPLWLAESIWKTPQDGSRRAVFDPARKL